MDVEVDPPCLWLDEDMHVASTVLRDEHQPP
jgi:hypothetical protein